MTSADPYDLARFVDAQEDVYSRVLAEIRAGRKQSHWMWFVFPQFEGLGSSPTSHLFAIKSVDEARAYLGHPILGARLLECSAALLGIQGRSAHDIFGSPDDMKLRSSATLFASVSLADSVFHRVLDTYFGGERDALTLRFLSNR